MAKSDVRPDFVPENAVNESEIPDVISNAPADWEWDVVTEETPTLILFNKSREQYPNDFDVFIGRFVGKDEFELIDRDTQEPKTVSRFLFRARDERLYAVNASYKLDVAMEKVNVDDWCRLTFVKEIPTNRKGNPVKDITVDVRRK